MVPGSSGINGGAILPSVGGGALAMSPAGAVPAELSGEEDAGAKLLAGESLAAGAPELGAAAAVEDGEPAAEPAGLDALLAEVEDVEPGAGAGAGGFSGNVPVEFEELPDGAEFVLDVLLGASVVLPVAPAPLVSLLGAVLLPPPEPPVVGIGPSSPGDAPPEPDGVPASSNVLAVEM